MDTVSDALTWIGSYRDGVTTMAALLAIVVFFTGALWKARILLVFVWKRYIVFSAQVNAKRTVLEDRFRLWQDRRRNPLTEVDYRVLTTLEDSDVLYIGPHPNDPEHRKLMRLRYIEGIPAWPGMAFSITADGQKALDESRRRSAG